MINVRQAMHIWALQSQSESRLDDVIKEDVIKEGERLSEIDAVDRRARHVKLSYAETSKPTVIYFFRPGCTWCERNASTLGSLAGQVSARYRMVGLSMSCEGLDEFLALHPMAFPVLSNPSPANLASMRLRVTPSTIVVSPQGVVLRSWSGAYIGETKSSVEAFFGVSLTD
jgi:peroxiredoxin